MPLLPYYHYLRDRGRLHRARELQGGKVRRSVKLIKQYPWMIWTPFISNAAIITLETQDEVIWKALSAALVPIWRWCE